jgi:hypothetical protein
MEDFDGTRLPRHERSDVESERSGDGRRDG